CVNVREGEQNKDRRNDKERAGNDPSPSAVHEPANVDSELGRLWTREQHTIVERMQETVFRYPATLLNQVTMHKRNLPRWSAEVNEAQLKPIEKRLGEGDIPLGNQRGIRNGLLRLASELGNVFACHSCVFFSVQLCRSTQAFKYSLDSSSKRLAN